MAKTKQVKITKGIGKVMAPTASKGTVGASATTKVKTAPQP